MILSIRKKRPTSLYKSRDNRKLMPVSVSFKSCTCSYDCHHPRTVYEKSKTVARIPFGEYVHICKNDKCPPKGIPLTQHKFNLECPCYDCR